MFQKILSIGLSLVLLSFFALPVEAVYPGPTPANPTPGKFPSAVCNHGILAIYLQPEGKSDRYAVRIDYRKNDWNPQAQNPGDLIDNNVTQSVLSMHSSGVAGTPTLYNEWFSWWIHKVNKDGSYGPAQGGTVYCPGEKVLTISHEYSYPEVTLKWNPVPGAKYYAIRVDNMKTPWNGDKDNLHEGDHLRNQMTETEFKFKAPKGRAISWWVHAVSPSGEYSEATGETFVTPE